MTSVFESHVSPEGIAELVFNLPGEKINKFSLDVLRELEAQLDMLAKNPAIKALKITSAKDEIYIAGADLHSFEKAFDSPEEAEKILQEGHRVFSKIEKLPFATIAVINGACLGGGTEFVLSCTYRLATNHPKTMIGLPEVNLGIYPGWGGTQRMPRLLGLTEGLNMILSGKIVPGLKAYKIKLVDGYIPWEFQSTKADDFIKEILTLAGKKRILERREKKSILTSLLEDNPIGRAFVYAQSKHAVMQITKGRYPAPLIALDVIKKSYLLPLEQGLKVEEKEFIENIKKGSFELSKYLIPLFFIQEAAKKETGAPAGIKPRETKAVGIIGAGTMGAVIAWLFADRHIAARLKDVTWEIIGKGIGTARALFDKCVKAKKLTKDEEARRFQLISGTLDYSGFSRLDLVIEAATENLELKRKIFQELESVLPEHTVIASNTSSLTIAEMSLGMKHPERFVAMHFFNPVHKMPLVEVVAGAQSSPEAVATAVEVCKKLGKTPIVVKDCAGFLVNRIFIPGANEVMHLLESGYAKEDIEKELLDFGMPMDPFSLADEVGNDVGYKVAKTLEQAYGERMRPPKLVELMAEKGLYGRKNGKGFFIYKGNKKTPNPEVNQLIKSTLKLQTALPKEEIAQRFLYSMINEAARCLEENVVAKPEYLDLSLLMGIGFPPFRGGLLRYADKVGTATIYHTLLKFSKEYGSRFAPSNLLERMAADGETFYKKVA